MSSLKPPFKARALFDYDSDYPDDLPFKTDQILTIDSIEDEEWFSGHFTNSSGLLQKGMFPRNFVEILKNDPVVPARPNTSRGVDKNITIEPLKREPDASLVDDETDEDDFHSPTEGKPSSLSKAQAQEPTQQKSVETYTTQPTESKSQPKSGNLRDKISAFNVGTTAPMPFSKPKEDKYIKKQFIAAAPSSYIPQPFKTEPKLSAQQSQPTHTDLPVNSEATKSDDQIEDAKPKLSLKERIALLQKTQQEEAERQQAALQKKFQKKEKKRQTTEDTQRQSHDETNKETAHITSQMEDLKLAGETPSIPVSTRTGDADIKEAQTTLRGATESQNLDKKNPYDRSEEENIQHEIADENEQERQELKKTEEDVEKEYDNEKEENGEGAEEEEEEEEEGEEEEEEEEEESDDEETRRRRLRERMAKISGGMGMFGMMGNPFGGPISVPPKQKQKKDLTEGEAKPVPILSMGGVLGPPPKVGQIVDNLTSEEDIEDSDEEFIGGENAEVAELLSMKTASPSKVPTHISDIPFFEEEVANKTVVEGITPDITKPELGRPIDTSSIKDEIVDDTSDKDIREVFKGEELTDAEEDEISESEYHTNLQNKQVSGNSSVIPPLPKSNTLEKDALHFSSDNEDISSSIHVNLPHSEIESEVTGYDGDEDNDRVHDRSTVSQVTPTSAPPIPSIPATQPPKLPNQLPPMLPSESFPQISSHGSHTSRLAQTPIEDIHEAPQHNSPRGVAPQVPSHAPPPPHLVSRDAKRQSFLPDPEDDFVGSNVNDSISFDEFKIPVKKSINRSSTFPNNAPPPVPAPHSKPSRTSTDLNRSPRPSIDTPPKVSRGSTEIFGRSLKKTPSTSESSQSLARDIDLESGSNWWLTSKLPDHLQSQNGVSLVYEIDTNEIPKRGNRKLVLRDYYILYQDYSETVIEVQYDPANPSSVSFKQFHNPAPVIRKDSLSKYSSNFGEKIATNAMKTVGNRLSEDLVSHTLRPLEGVLKPIGNKTYGATIYSNANNVNVHKIDDFKPGDILCIKKGKFQGVSKLRQKIEHEVGYGDAPHTTIIIEFDQTKKKFRVLEQDSHGIVKKESYKLTDFKSGKIRVFRVVGRDFVRW